MWRRGATALAALPPAVHLGVGDLSCLLGQWGFRGVGRRARRGMPLGRCRAHSGAIPPSSPPLGAVLCGAPPPSDAVDWQAPRSEAKTEPPDTTSAPIRLPSATRSTPHPRFRPALSLFLRPAPISRHFPPPSPHTHSTSSPSPSPHAPLSPLLPPAAHHGLHWRRCCPGLGPRRPRVCVHVALRLCRRPGGRQGDGPPGRCADHEVSF